MPAPEQPHQASLRKGRYSQPFGLYHITKCVRRGSKLGGSQQDAIVEALRHMVRTDNLHLQAFIIMPDHVHLLIALGLRLDLSHTISEWCRRATNESKAGGAAIKWQKGFHDHKVREGESVVDIVNYIERNPVRKELCSEPSAWEWSSANPAHQSLLDRPFLGPCRWEPRA